MRNRSSRVVALIALAAVVPAPLAAQRDSAGTSTRGTLLRATAEGPRGMTPIEYFNASVRADRLLTSETPDSIAAAEQLYTQLADAYPLDGENWARLARARIRQENWHAAIDAASRALQLGSWYQGSLYQGFTQRGAYAMAVLHARAGQPDSALVWLRHAVIDERFERRIWARDEASFATLHDNAEFRRLALMDSIGGVDRTTGWRRDIDALLDEFRRTQQKFATGLPDSIRAAAESLSARVPKLADAEMWVGLQRLIAMLGDSHSNMFWWESSALLNLEPLPFALWTFPDGVFIVAADSAHRHLVGAQILMFDRTPADSALAVASSLVHTDHPKAAAHRLWTGTGFLLIPTVLHALGIVDRPDTVALTVRDRTGDQRVVRIGRSPTRIPRRLKPPTVPGLGTPPIWLRQPDQPFWVQPLPQYRSLYVGFNDVTNTQAETLDQFGLRVRALIDSLGVSSVIVDVRHNDGGDSYLYRELLRTLIAFDAKPQNRLFVAIGRSTFSATGNFITEVDRLTNAVFVGEPSGAAPVQFGGDISLSMLPYSRAGFAIGTTVWQLTSPRDTRPYIAPDIPIALTAADYFANRDPVMETLFDLIGGSTYGRADGWTRK